MPYAAWEAPVQLSLSPLSATSAETTIERYLLPAKRPLISFSPGETIVCQRSCGWSLYYLLHVQTAAGENYTLLQIPGRLAGEQWNTSFCTLPVWYSKQTQMVRIRKGACSCVRAAADDHVCLSCARSSAPGAGGTWIDAAELQRARWAALPILSFLCGNYDNYLPSGRLCLRFPRAGFI